MKCWHGSCLGALIALLLAGGSMIFFVPMGGAMLVSIPPVFDRLTAYTLCHDAVDYSYRDYNFGVPTTSSPGGGAGAKVLFVTLIAAMIGGRLVKPKVQAG